MALELVFDFDGTITEADSIASVVDAALSHHKASSSLETFTSLADSWHQIVRSYKEDLDSYHRNPDYTIQRDHPTSLEVARAQFSNQQRRRIEQASLLRVQDAGLFLGVPLEHLYHCGQEHRENKVVRLRNAFSEFIHLVKSHSVRASIAAAISGPVVCPDKVPTDTRKQSVERVHSTHVLSVNWSATYVRGFLSREGISPIIANETNPVDGSINAVPAGIDSAEWPSVLAVGSDKLSALRWLQRQQREVKTKLPVEVVYFGDSTTDLECLLEFGGIVMISPKAEIVQRPGTKTADPNGIAVRGSDLLHMLQTRLNYIVPHVSGYKDELICWARDFAEIVQSSFLQKRAANVRATKSPRQCQSNK